MNENLKIRKRVNIKQTTKCIHQVDVTVETFDESDPVNLAIELINDTEKKLKADGRETV